MPAHSQIRCVLFIIACAACNEPRNGSAVGRGDDAGVLFPVPPPVPDETTDRIIPCDQAPDGTACGDGGTQHCVFGVCAANLCGDGVLAGQEQCDDGNDFDDDGCPANCQLTAICRDGTVDQGEECDDGNRIDDDECSNSCRRVVCGNGRVDPGEECDDGNTRDGDACSSTCQGIVCGNGRVDPGEMCDGLLGCSGAGEACDKNCGRCEADKCGACSKSKCQDYSGINVYGGCRDKVDAMAGTGAQDSSFVQKCSALDDCLRQNPRCVTDLGPIACYCGALSVAACQVADKVAGPCASLYPAATGCDSGEGQSNCVLNNFVNLYLPAGWSNYLSECRYTECAAECGY